MNHSTTRATILPEIIHKHFIPPQPARPLPMMKQALTDNRRTIFLAYIWKRRTEAAVDGIPYRTAQAGSSGCQKMRKALGSAMSCRNRSPLTHVKLPTGAETRMS